jgi:sugar phosphate isomerase/epimerase
LKNFGIEKKMLGLGSYAFRHAINSRANPMDVFSFIGAASKLGFSRVLLCENLRYDGEDYRYYKKLKDLLAEKDMIAETGMKGINPEAIKRHIDIATILDSPFLRLVIGEGKDNNSTVLKENALKAIEKILPFLEDNNLVLGIENHFDLSTDDICDIVHTLDSRQVAIIYDSTNGLGLLERPFETLEKINGHIISAHIKNFVSRKVDGGYFLAGTNPDEGELDIKKMAAKIMEYNPSCSFIVEFNIKPEKPLTGDELLLWERECILAHYNYFRAWIQN